MKVLGMKKKNFILEVTPYEMKTITTTLSEWGEVESNQLAPASEFNKVLNRVYRSKGKFLALPLISEKEWGKLKQSENNLVKIKGG